MPNIRLQPSAARFARCRRLNRALDSMGNEQKSYQVPTETLASLELSHHLEDLVEIRDFLRGRGIETRNTRIDRYVAYLQQATSHDPTDASRIFKNSVEGPFKRPIDWMLYVLREVHELMWILKGLKVHFPAGMDKKLKIISGGSDFASLDTDSQSRDIQFELRIASYFCQAGYEVDLSTETDIIALTDDQAFYLECKRVGSQSQLAKRLSEGGKQLQNRMPKKNGKRIVFGCVAADVTRVAFSHSGLTWGLTNEHSRDVVQEKLIGIAKASDKLPLFRDCRNLFCYWLQIHISSLILQPAMRATRFSSYHILRNRLSRKERRAATVFYGMFESVSRGGDERETPAKELRLRTRINAPKGTTFSLDDGLRTELLERGKVTEREQNEIVGTLSMNGKNYEFSFFDFRMMSARFIKDWRKTLSEDPIQARFQLVMEMYVQRFPYEESRM
jgi:hypothetical protein